MYLRNVSSKSVRAQALTSPLGGVWAHAGVNVQPFGNPNLIPRLTETSMIVVVLHSFDRHELIERNPWEV